MHNVFRSILRVTVTGVLAAGLGLPVQTGHAQPQHQRKVEFRVQHFTSAEGLPSNAVYSIQEDSLGFLWLGTTNGLVRYDGYTFTSFLPQPNDSTSIGGIHITALHVDATGDLWAGGGFLDPGGLGRFDVATERFRRYRHDPEEPNSLIYDDVAAITTSPYDPGVFWMGGGSWPIDQDGGLSRLDVATGTFTHYTTEDGLASNLVRTLLVDRNGTLWIGTGEPFLSPQAAGGLSRFDPATNTFTSFLPHPAHAPEDAVNLIYTIYEASMEPGVLWVGTWGGGLNRFDRETETFTAFFPQPGDPSDPRNMVSAVLEDRAGTPRHAEECARRRARDGEEEGLPRRAGQGA